MKNEVSIKKILSKQSSCSLLLQYSGNLWRFPLMIMVPSRRDTLLKST